jgi:hypothetical protein
VQTIPKNVQFYNNEDVFHAGLLNGVKSLKEPYLTLDGILVGPSKTQGLFVYEIQESGNSYKGVGSESL